MIIPAFRASHTIGRALDSLRAQTRPPDEVIVVDDGSPDGLELAAVLKGRPEPIRLVRQTNAGAANARNTGIDLTTGSLVAFLDADDYWEPDKLSLQAAIMEAHPEVGLVAGRFFAEEPGQGRRDLAAFAGPSTQLDQAMMLQGSQAFAVATLIWTTTVLVRREVLGTHRFVSGLEPAEDRDLWVRLVSSTSVYLTSQPVATNVLEPNSLSRSSIDTDCGNMLKVVRRHARLLGRRQVRHWEADTFRRWASVHLSQNHPGRAVLPAASRLCREPFSVQGWYILGKSLFWSVKPRRPPVAISR